MSVTPTQLAYLPQNDENALLDWLGYHAQIHHQIATKAVNDGHTNLGTFPVAILVRETKDDWAYYHYQEHVEIAQTYKLDSPPDLSYWDFDDPINWNNWLQAHALIHQNELQALKL